jgi:acetylornithine deacetylase/succinyl-diaminopimelate desuccinylase-like protein
MTESDKREYFELLRFKSIGVNKENLKDCVDCAQWLKNRFIDIGFDSKLKIPAELSGPPVVYAERIVDPYATTVLVYGHYDVQPAEPLELWNTSPFDPTEINSRVYCRGAQDDKGQFFAFFCGLRKFLKENASAKINIKIFLEGQEESSGAVAKALVSEMAGDLKADILLVSDTNAGYNLRPCIIAGLRGMDLFTVTLRAANRDLHSGLFGALAPNAAQGMAELVSSLHNPDGSIAGEGFFDGMEIPTEKELALSAQSVPTEEKLAETIGCPPEGGEKGKSIAMRNCFMPTVEVNGIHSGYGGPGSKTIIPCEAFAKISMRLVPGQSPVAVFEAVKKHLEKNVPRGMKMEISEAAGFSPGFKLNIESPIFKIAQEVLFEIDERGPLFLWDGASIPFVELLARISGASPLLVGWGQPDDNIHSPNESFSYVQFDKAALWAEKIFMALSNK